MNTEKNNQYRLLRITGLTAVILFGIISVLGSGGGGDDEGGGDSTDVGLLSIYAFTIGQGYDSTGTESAGMSISVGSTALLTVDPNEVKGTFSCDPATEICGLYTIDTTTSLNLVDETIPPVVGDITMTIPEQVLIGTSGLPIIGRIQFASTVGNLVIEFDICAEGGAGVNIYVDDVILRCVPWSEFEQLFDTSEVPAEQIASFGYQVIQFLFEQVNFVTEVFRYVDDFTVDLQEGGTISESCDAFSLAGTVPPDTTPDTTIADQGIRSLSWIDVNSDGNVGPGDSFLGSLDNCWFNDLDLLLNGFAEFSGYVQNVDLNREVITSLGFTSVSPPNPGGVFFNDYTIAETEVISPTNTEITNVIGVEGGFSILFNEPAP